MRHVSRFGGLMLIRGGKGSLPALSFAINTHNQVPHRYGTVLLSTLNQPFTQPHSTSIEKTPRFESYCLIFWISYPCFVVRSRRLISGLSFIHFCIPISSLYILIRWIAQKYTFTANPGALYTIFDTSYRTRSHDRTKANSAATTRREGTDEPR